MGGGKAQRQIQDGRGAHHPLQSSEGVLAPFLSLPGRPSGSQRSKTALIAKLMKTHEKLVKSS